ncbi:hypothetical protein SCARR_02246 [Pontiella sulfatireligans]|uniref:Uncharacterized protein n=1 Tax=Pontiella sulfatireligans TaxID=2750658 RepID=A0A6C2UIZ0_9BACT|nr:hypothetical protein SCARR_02246 [Pontiella sulfatireligans]
MAGKDKIIFPAVHRLAETARIVAMQQGNLFAGHLHLAKTAEQMNANVRREKLPIARIGIDVAQHGIDGNAQRMENAGEFGKHIAAPDIAAMEHRADPGPFLHTGGFFHHRQIAVRIG